MEGSNSFSCGKEDDAVWVSREGCVEWMVGWDSWSKKDEVETGCAISDKDLTTPARKSLTLHTSFSYATLH
jgi:hypothetical protein